MHISSRQVDFNFRPLDLTVGAGASMWSRNVSILALVTRLDPMGAPFISSLDVASCSSTLELELFLELVFELNGMSQGEFQSQPHIS